jgi:hypothetical protein
MNVGDGSLHRLNVEDPARTHSYLAHIGALLRPACHDGTHEVARLEAFDALGSFWLRARKPMLVHEAHLS